MRYAAIAVLWVAGAVSADVPARPAYYPREAHFVPVAEAGRLQKALDEHKVVRLQWADYRGRGPKRLVLRSGCAVYGLYGTAIPEVVVEPGTTGAILSSVNPVQLTFPPSAEVTRENLFYRIERTRVRIDRACLAGNRFVGLHNVSIHADNTAGGFLRNNGFIRTMVHQAGPDIVLKGNATTPSYGNVLLWLNILTPRRAPIELAGLKDLAIVGLDAESWNWEGRSDRPLITTGPMGTLRLFAAQGANLRNGGANATGLLDTAATEVRAYGVNLWGKFTSPNILLPKACKRLLWAAGRNFSIGAGSAETLIVKAFLDGKGEVSVNGKAVGNRLPGPAARALEAMLAPPEAAPKPWRPPAYREPPAPLGGDWRAKAAEAGDRSAELQKRIDAEGIVLLDAGVYAIGRPLRIGKHQGLVGAGRGKTVLVARRDDMALITCPQGDLQPFVLADLSLRGGRYGIHHSTPWMRGTGVCISHVTFRDHAGAGIFLDKINCWDNNLLDQVNFVHCGAGLLQHPNPAYPGGHTASMCFVDKTVFYRCGFVRCGVGLDMPARRPNNLNACIECTFLGCRDAAMRLTNSTTHLLANSQFVGNGGSPTIASNKPVPLVSCRFVIGPKTRSLLPPETLAEGCVFTRGRVGRAAVVADGRVNHFINCRADLPVGALRSGLLLNNRFAGVPALSRRAVAVRDGRATALVGTGSDPKPDLLVTRE